MIEAIKEAGKLLNNKTKGKEWVDEALPIIVEVAKEIRILEVKKKEETDPLTELINEIREKYKGALQVLAEIDDKLRDRIMKEYEETKSIKQEGIGELVFPERWGYRVIDIKKVEPRFLTVDGKAISEEIGKGVRKIKGIEILKRRTLQVRPQGGNDGK